MARNSPDLSPTENSWDKIKNRLRFNRLSLLYLIKLTKSVFAHLLSREEIVKNCQNFVGSMPKRVKQVLKNKGGHISY